MVEVGWDNFCVGVNGGGGVRVVREFFLGGIRVDRDKFSDTRGTMYGLEVV